jgi:abortive infection bacteriophage resistance protein
MNLKTNQLNTYIKCHYDTQLTKAVIEWLTVLESQDIYIPINIIASVCRFDHWSKIYNKKS